MNRFYCLDIEMSYRDIGEYFGYPKCCIDMFEKEFGQKRTRKHCGKNGFVPCSQCADKILAGETTIDQLIKNRECEKPFPISDGRRIIYRKLRFRLDIVIKTKLKFIQQHIIPIHIYG